jgi:ribosomal protein S27AE
MAAKKRGMKKGTRKIECPKCGTVQMVIVGDKCWKCGKVLGVKVFKEQGKG